MNFESKVRQKSNTCQLFNFCLKIRFLAFPNSLSYLRSNIFRVIFLGCLDDVVAHRKNTPKRRWKNWGNICLGGIYANFAVFVGLKVKRRLNIGEKGMVAEKIFQKIW